MEKADHGQERQCDRACAWKAARLRAGCLSNARGGRQAFPDRLFPGVGRGDEGKALGNCISSFIFEWQWGDQVWLAQPVFEGWQQFQGDNFHMQALAFNRFLFVWSLKRRTKSRLKLNILVPR